MKEVDDSVVVEAEKFLAQFSASVGYKAAVCRALGTGYVVHRLAAYAESGGAFLAEAKRTIEATIRSGGETAREALLFSLRRPKWALVVQACSAGEVCYTEYLLRIADLLADPEAFDLLTIPVG